MSKHIPGPWTMYNTGYAVGVTGSKKTDVAIYENKYWHPLDSDRSAEETGANARLIAAAPELLEALKAVNDAFPFYQQMSRPVFDKVHAAIAKAEGRA